LHAELNLAQTTRAYYATAWDVHVLPRLGGLELRRITPEVIEAFRGDLRAAGVGAPTIRKVLSILQGVMTRAVVLRKITANPVTPIRKPTQARARTVRPLAPIVVEQLRSELADRDAVLVSVLAYAGVRPGEALALRWGDLRERTILVERSLALGELKGTKTNKSRSVRLLAPLAADPKEYRFACGRPGDGQLLFPRRDGAPWTDFDWRNWRRRVFTPAATRAGLAVRPYDLRHSFVSLLIAEGASIVEVARQAGHSPAVALNVYGHVIEELEGGERRSAEAVIREARDSRVPLVCPSIGDAAGG
jgi:integrase